MKRGGVSDLAQGEGRASKKRDHSQASERELIWLWFLTGGCSQFRLVHRLFFNNLEK
jgi:hypothetical protein